MTYGRFLEYLEMGWVKQVDLYDNSRNAIVQASSPELGNRPQAIRVEIPIGASQLIQKLKEYNIDFDAHPAPRKNIFITIASNLLLPLIFISGLIFFFQSKEFRKRMAFTEWRSFVFRCYKFIGTASYV